MSVLPADLQDVLDQVNELDRAGVDLAASVTDEQFFWRPDGGRAWSIALCLEHLATANEVYSRAVGEAVDAARVKGWARRGPLRLGPAGRWFVNSLEPPVTRRMRAPSKIQPASTGSRAGILAHYREAHEAIRSIIAACADIDVNRATFRNPFIGLPFRVSTGLRVVPAHDRRHLWQARRVTQADGFPDPSATAR